MQEFDPIAYINEPRWLESRMGLDRSYELMERLGNPHQKLKFVHVAGTNGKGSTCAFLASILQNAGYKTGLFTSPYIVEFCDRIRINGNNIPLDRLRDVTLQVKQAAEAMEDHPTEFELMTAIAFLYFAEEECDIVVCEVGMGGRLDSTNIIESPELSIIASIAIDHASFLGHTISAIASEKAGIIKEGRPVLSYPQAADAQVVIERIAETKNAPVSYPDFTKLHFDSVDGGALRAAEAVRTFSYDNFQDLSIRLLGDYQPYNAALALEAVGILRQNGWEIDEAAIRDGFSSTAWPGRFEIVNTNPLFILDGAHNVQGANALASSMKELLPDQKPVFIIGLLEDKEYLEMLAHIVPLGRAFITITPPTPRALSAQSLASAIKSVSESTSTVLSDLHVSDSFDDAISYAFELAGSEGIICACGSLYSIASLKEALAKKVK